MPHHGGNDMTDTPTPPEGWYPDPAGGGGLRRWSGTAWTEEVRASATEPPFFAPAATPHGASVSSADATARPVASPGSSIPRSLGTTP